jgi:hypothetical protein
MQNYFYVTGTAHTVMFSIREKNSTSFTISVKKISFAKNADSTKNSLRMKMAALSVSKK